MYSVDLVSDKAAFLALEGEWNDAVDRAAIAHPFLRHEWVRMWWDAFGDSHQLNILVVRHAARVCAIAPLMFERAQMYGMPVRRMRFLQKHHTPRTDARCQWGPSTSKIPIARSGTPFWMQALAGMCFN